MGSLGRIREFSVPNSPIPPGVPRRGLLGSTTSNPSTWSTSYPELPYFIRTRNPSWLIQWTWNTKPTFTFREGFFRKEEFIWRPLLGSTTSRTSSWKNTQTGTLFSTYHNDRRSIDREMCAELSPRPFFVQWCQIDKFKLCGCQMTWF